MGSHRLRPPPLRLGSQGSDRLGGGGETLCDIERAPQGGACGKWGLNLKIAAVASPECTAMCLYVRSRGGGGEGLSALGVLLFVWVGGGGVIASTLTHTHTHMPTLYYTPFTA